MNHYVPAWYCVRTQAKPEHIATASLIGQLGLEVFFPRLRVERATGPEVVQVSKPWFFYSILASCMQGFFNFLGYATITGTYRESIAVDNRSLAELLPSLAAGVRRMLPGGGSGLLWSRVSGKNARA